MWKVANQEPIAPATIPIRAVTKFISMSGFSCKYNELNLSASKPVFGYLPVLSHDSYPFTPLVGSHKR